MDLSRRWFVASACSALFVGSGCSGRRLAAAPEAPPQTLSGSGYVVIGGIEQWITFSGTDRRNPVILFLHGGPGIAASPFAASTTVGWERDFTLVQWDQRGAGRTYARNLARAEALKTTLTLDQISSDGIEVAEYVRKRLGAEKIIITGGSWGSAVGIRMAYARPDLFHAFVGLSQSTNWLADEAAAYARIRELASAKGDSETVSALDAIGPPPWHSRDTRRPFRQAQLSYQVARTTEAGLPFSLASEYESDLREGRWQAAGDYSQGVFFGETLSGPIMGVDVAGLTEFEIPIFIIHGEEDLTIPIERARAYFNAIRAPQKDFFAVPGTAHEPSARMVGLQKEVLLTRVSPLID